MGRPKDPMSPYRMHTIRAGKNGSTTYAVTYLGGESVNGKRSSNMLFWGRITEGNVFEPLPKFQLLPDGEKRKYIFPSEWDISKAFTSPYSMSTDEAVCDIPVKYDTSMSIEPALNEKLHEQKYFEKHPQVIALLHAIREAAGVISDLSLPLQSSMSISINLKYWVAYSKLYDSCNRTLWSLDESVRLGNFSDALMLVRKYRDDMLFYVYCSLNYEEYLSSIVSTANGDKTKIKPLIDWMNNKRKDKSINIFSQISCNPRFRGMIQKFAIDKRYTEYNKKLNSFTHTNGIEYINYDSVFYRRHTEALKTTCTLVKENIQFYTILFLSLIAILHPNAISASDYIDCLEMGIEPEEGSQYWLAPFIEEYFKNNGDVIDTGLIDFLNETTCMQFK